MNSSPPPRIQSNKKMRNVFLTYRRVFVIAAHLAMWTASLYGAFLLRFEFSIPSLYLHSIARWLVLLLIVRSAVHLTFGLFHGLWRYSSSRDLIALVKASVVSTAMFALAVFFIGPAGLPRTVIIMDWLGSVLIVGGVRFTVRAIREIAVQVAKPPPEGRKKILIVGAGDAGEMLMREIVRTHAAKYEPVGFVDDSQMKLGERIHGLPVLGKIERVPEIVQNLGVEEVIIAMPSLNGKEMRRIVELCTQANARVRTLPGMDRLIDGRVTVSQLQSVKIDDLLGREAVKLDADAISEFVRARVVLVTGAGGSIGSELCRQIARFGPRKILLVEQAENNLFHIHRNLVREFPDVSVVPCVADICDTKRMSTLFAEGAPQVVFHAAAHKHVPMMEENPGEAIKNNVFGTKKVADLADEYGVEKFVMVSTDKAVNPTSVMGVSKRCAEIYVQSLSQRSKTHYVTVRFGNVLGSTGSVVPLFRRQLERGGPLTVTHPEMQRYFMTVREAVGLVLQASVLGVAGAALPGAGQGGIFVLDMGDPVRIVDLARQMIRLAGLQPAEGGDAPGSIRIEFTGLRPGEKLYEELFHGSEPPVPTGHPGLLMATPRTADPVLVGDAIDCIAGACRAGQPGAALDVLGRMVPEFDHAPHAMPAGVPAAVPGE